MTSSHELSTWQPVLPDAPRATKQWIAIRARVLLRHGYQVEMSEAEEAMMLADWIDSLSDLPQAAIEGAIRHWLRNEDRRATPAAIRRLAQARIEPRKPPAPEDDEWPFAPVVVPQEELQRRREMSARLAEAYPMLNRVPKCEGD